MKGQPMVEARDIEAVPSSHYSVSAEAKNVALSF